MGATLGLFCNVPFHSFQDYPTSVVVLVELTKFVHGLMTSLIRQEGCDTRLALKKHNERITMNELKSSTHYFASYSMPTPAKLRPLHGPRDVAGTS